MNPQGKSAWNGLLIIAISTMLTAPTASAQSLKTLVNFDGTNGGYPYFMSLVQGADGNLYGTTYQGGNLACGEAGCGTVFKVTPGGALETLYTFCSQSNTCADGAYPFAGLVLGSDGNFYGTASNGGTAGGYGTIFRITPEGALTVLHNFESTDGAFPFGALIQASDGNFYGTTGHGGADTSCSQGCGTVFKMSPEGKLSTLHSFHFTDGYDPVGGLVEGANGDFYGTTSFGGANDYGTVFQITPQGKLTTLHSFDWDDGAYPYAALVPGSDGRLYGTTNEGATASDGTVFAITPGGTLTTLHIFLGYPTDGGDPTSGLVEGTDGRFYGTAYDGGVDGSCSFEVVGCGTAYRITPGGTLTTLLSFDSTDGANPIGGLVQATNGSFYGTTWLGGVSDEGTLFGLSVGLYPFVRTVPVSDKVGASVRILGTDLTAATSVTFNGSAAIFTVQSASAIETTVPAGATTGPVQVTLPSGTLTSNVSFQVLP
jgi:uncharacterized repeat protein (TIGR03803 family)